MLKPNEDNIFHFHPKKIVKWDYILLFTTFVPFFAIGVPFLLIFETYPNITIISKMLIVIASIILTFSFFFFGIWLGPAINKVIITDESITRKKFCIVTTIHWSEIMKFYEEKQFLTQRVFGNRFFTIRSRKKWFTFSDKIIDYEKLKEIIMERAEAKYFKHYEGRMGEGWVK